ncbi:MAG: ABC transporter substrate-binding protein [Eubacteriales bacterium]|nr:ABC transporter substrate-binding protein [Eubacteriales bacterium]MDD3536639.1 ABC transporter substrate-binding protein [Eubacteriales bacterium]HPF19434.1 ABC transporter substrate-binding protein [Bacillota bacterium]
MKKVIFTVLLAMLLTVVGCTPERQATESFVFTDSCGREVEIVETDSIAPTGAMAQMVLMPLASDLFCGLASDWSSDAERYLQEELLRLPLYGQIFNGKGDMSLEEVIRLSPDVLIDIGETRPGMEEELDRLQEQTGIPTVHIQATLDTMSTTYEMLGTLLGRQEKAEELSLYCDEIYQRTEEIITSLDASEIQTVVYCLGDKGLNVLAKGSYHAELLDILCENAAVLENPSPSGFGNEVDMEQLLLWDPDWILFAPDSIYDSVGSDPLWNRLAAISSGRYAEVPQGPYNWMGMPPSVNRYLGMIWLTNLLYPEHTNYDLYEEISRYYILFYDHALSEDLF